MKTFVVHLSALQGLTSSTEIFSLYDATHLVVCNVTVHSCITSFIFVIQILSYSMTQDKCYSIKRNTRQACHLSLRDMTPIPVKILLAQAVFFFKLNFKEDQNQASCGSSLSHNKFCLGSQVACGLFPKRKFCS